MIEEIPLWYSITLYGIVLFATLMALVVLGAHHRLKEKRATREAALLSAQTKTMEALNTQAMELAQRQGLHTLGMLTSNIAHEFNNLLTPIMGYSMLALERITEDDEELYDDLLEIYDAARRAKEIIARLSELNRKKAAFLYKFILIDDVMRRIGDVIEPVKPHSVTVQMELNCAHTFVLADETRLHQMMLNLCMNAFQAMDTREDGKLTIRTEERNGHARISVQDTGCGIAKEHIGEIFEPFFTTKEPGKGTGLGLAIARQIVTELNGEMSVQSEAGRGTTMHVSIPLPEENTFLNNN